MSRLREISKFGVDSARDVASPWVRQDLDRDLHSGRFIKLKRWMLYARTARAKARGDTAALQRSLFQYWQADTGDDFYDQYLDRYQNWFLGPHHAIVDQLAMLSRGGGYTKSGLLVLCLQVTFNFTVLVLPVAPAVGCLVTYWIFAVTYFIAASSLFVIFGPKPLFGASPGRNRQAVTQSNL